jgi:NAD(P)-dependent dehydrogenase (short-subunit alcohol dehydrogenase family)
LTRISNSRGRKAIITGSTAEGLARAGASVIINGRGRPTGLEKIGPRTSRTALGRDLRFVDATKRGFVKFLD